MIWRRKKTAENRDDQRQPRKEQGGKSARNEPGLVRLYGDRANDGAVQLSFTLPVPCGDKAKVAAELMCQKMNLKDPKIIHMEAMSENYTFFVVYAVCSAEVDFSRIELPKLDYPLYTMDQVNDLVMKKLGRKLVVLGACIGSDAHTVGIDAIFNMKGYLGDYGLERYSCFDAKNLRAQVDTKAFIEKIIEHKADAILVSRVVTQRDEHIKELTKLLDEIHDNHIIPTYILKICGGPRLDHRTAIDIGYDAGFGQGTKPSQVASYIATELVHRLQD